MIELLSAEQKQLETLSVEIDRKLDIEKEHWLDEMRAAKTRKL